MDTVALVMSLLALAIALTTAALTFRKIRSERRRVEVAQQENAHQASRFKVYPGVGIPPATIPSAPIGLFGGTFGVVPIGGTVGVPMPYPIQAPMPRPEMIPFLPKRIDDGH
ncbi:MAG: hypothetical protein DI630_00965 [Gordonia sp. (in: high G+C Gram-positive bacteria)]|nr:MAG: hypothetical protein DI630_00965 [Gordonia sp. (in: high G+C Gram-positive bacteria)]